MVNRSVKANVLCEKRCENENTKERERESFGILFLGKFLLGCESERYYGL